MNMKKRFLAGAVVILFLLSVFFACENGVVNIPPEYEPPPDYEPLEGFEPLGGGEFWFLGWQWEKDDNNPDLEFQYIFENDGTISVIHCCELVFPDQFSYLFCGNTLVTYGSEMASDKRESNTFTVADNGASFTMANKTSFTRGAQVTDPSSTSPIVLSNDLLGTWQRTDGSEWEFRSDTGLQITSSSDSQQYGYLVRKDKLVTLGPITDTTGVALQEYQFSRKGINLTLTSLGVTDTFKLLR